MELEQMTEEQTSQQRVSFLRAIKTGDIEAVKSLLESMEPSEFLNFTVQGSPLHFAVKSGQVEIVKLLLEHFDVNAINHEYETPITAAVREGNEEMVKFLLEQGAKVFYREFDQAPAGTNGEPRPVNSLLQACLQQDEKMVKLLLKSGAKLYGLMTGEDYLPLNNSVRMFLKNNREDILDLLCEYHQESSSVLNAIASQALLFAYENNDTKQFGAIMNFTSLSQFFSLHDKRYIIGIICSYCHKLSDITVLKPFLDLIDADASAKGSMLHRFIHSEQWNALRFFLEQGADVNTTVKCEQDRSPLYMAVGKSRMDFVEFLLEHGADINVGFGKKLDCYEPSNHHPRVKMARFFVKLVVEKVTEGQAVDEAHLTSINGIKELKEFKIQCENEIERMKENFTGSEISPYDLWKTTDLLQLTAHLMNRDIEDFLRPDMLELKFPIYAADINKRLREILLIQVSNFFQNLSTRGEDHLPLLPDNRLQTIFACLGNEDLVKLRNACYCV